MRVLFRIVIFVLVPVFLAIQLVPYGRDHDNPKTVQEVKWNEPATRALAVDACFACHSNLTDWPWYTNVAPVSWLTTRDVEDGRKKLNFSEWQRPQDVNLQEIIDSIRSEGMPPLQYRVIHSESRLSASERQQLERGFIATWGKDPPGR